MIAASCRFDLAGEGVAVVGHVPGGLPPLRWPDVSWSETLDLLPVAASCFVMIIAQSAATSRVYGIKHHERVDENADILGIAVANAGAALTGAFVVNGSPTQTAMADEAGARSQFAQLVFAGIVAIVLIALTGPLQYLPRCVLAGVVFTIAVGMIDVRGMKDILTREPGRVPACPCHRRGRADDWGRAGDSGRDRAVAHPPRPPQLPSAHDGARGPDPEGRWMPTPAKPGEQTGPGLIVYRFGADLFYANADRFADEARALIGGAPDPVQWFIVDASAITDMDYSAARTLRDLFAELASEEGERRFRPRRARSARTWSAMASQRSWARDASKPRCTLPSRSQGKGDAKTR